MPAASGWGVTLLCVIALTAGCTSVAGDPSLAGSAAQDFHAALASGEPDAACELLAPGTLTGLEESSGTSCRKALADEGLPDAVAVTTTDVYGTNARVVLKGDTVFLARFGSQWKVTAAGCTPRPGLPYHCAVKGP